MFRKMIFTKEDQDSWVSDARSKIFFSGDNYSVSRIFMCNPPSQRLANLNAAQTALFYLTNLTEIRHLFFLAARDGYASDDYERHVCDILCEALEAGVVPSKVTFGDATSPSPNPTVEKVWVSEGYGNRNEFLGIYNKIFRYTKIPRDFEEYRFGGMEKYLIGRIIDKINDYVTATNRESIRLEQYADSVVINSQEFRF